MAFRVKDAAAAFKRCIELGAKPVATRVGPMELNIPAIDGIGGSLIYLVDRYGERTIYDVDFVPVPPAAAASARGLTYIDHLTHNVHRGNMDKWAGFYEKLFNFREIRYFDIEGKKTGLFTRAMTSPCGKIRIPINESQDDKSQIEEYLREYQRRGHPAHRARHRRHLSAPSTCCAATACSSRTRPRPITRAWTRACRGHRENLEELRKRRILHRRQSGEGRGRAAADLHAERHRPDLLRDHPAQGQRRVWRRQLPRVVRIHRAGPDAQRRVVRSVVT